MAAARHIPPLEDVAQTITFTYANSLLTVSPGGVIIAPGEQVNFSNSANSSAAINITFNPNPPGPPAGPTLFTNISGLAAGATNSQNAPNSAGSVNYTVTIGAKTYGPYAIQVGIGPLYVQITSADCLPDPAVIPPGGKLEMFSADVTVDSYDVRWQTTDPFTPALTSASQGMQGNTVRAGTNTLGQYVYTVNLAPMQGNGGGKIIVTN